MNPAPWNGEARIENIWLERPVMVMVVVGGAVRAGIDAGTQSLLRLQSSGHGEPRDAGGWRLSRS